LRIAGSERGEEPGGAKGLRLIRNPRKTDAEFAKNLATLSRNRACFRSGEIRVLDTTGIVESTIPFSDADRKL
jgi:hypothetical protein